MRVLSLFSGAGGSCLGWHRAGATHLGCAELDADACDTLEAAGFPALRMDLSSPEGRGPLERYRGRVDVLEASPPCQAWSTAGSRLGARDPRNGWPWTWAVSDLVAPTWLIAENVPGLLSHRGECPTRDGGYPDPMGCPGCYWSEVILIEARRRFGWVGWWRLNAADYGVPQHRRRVFLVCGPRAIAPPIATHGDPASLGQGGLFGPRLLPWRTMGEALALGGAADDIGGGRNASAGTRSYRQIGDEPSTTVAAAQIGNAGPWVVQHIEGTPRITRSRTGRLRLEYPYVPGADRVIRGPSDLIRRHPLESPDLPASAVTACTPLFIQHMEGAPRELGHPAPALGAKGNMMLIDRPSLTVSATEVKGAGARAVAYSRGEDVPLRLDRPSGALLVTTGRRRLTIEEVAALQGFPGSLVPPEGRLPAGPNVTSSYPWRGTKTAQYRQVGNAVPPQLAQAVAESIVKTT